MNNIALENTKEVTKRQVNGIMLFMLSVFPVLYFILMSYELPVDMLLYNQLNIIYLIITDVFRVLSYVTYIIWLMAIIKWFVRNKAYLGLRKAFKHWLMIFKIRRMFLDSNYYVNRVYLGRNISEPLNIELDIKSNGQAILYVENHMKFDSKLDGARLSSALGTYIVENDYITDDNNFYVYELLDYRTVMSQNKFSDYDSYNQWCTDKIDDYELKIDDRLKVNFGHFLIVGQTGSGKTYALYHLILQSMMKSENKRAQMHYLDPKASSLMSVGKILSPETTPVPKEGSVSNFEEMKNEIEKVYNLMLKRQIEISSKLDTEKLDADYRDFNMKPIVLIIDEWAVLSKQISSETKKEESRNIMNMVSDIIFMGRQLGVFLWAIMQQSNAKAMPTEIRDNMMFRTVLGNSERTTYETAFSAGEVAEIPNTKKKPGIGVYRYSGSSKNKLSLLAFPFLDFDLIEEFVRLSSKIK